MYGHIINSESVKQEKKILEKKFINKEKKIAKLEYELSVTREQVSSLKEQIHILISELTKYTKATDENGNLIVSSLIDQGINPELIKHNKGIVKSRKGGKSKNNNSLPFQELQLLYDWNIIILLYHF